MAKGKENPLQFSLTNLARCSQKHFNKEINIEQVKNMVKTFLAEFT